MVLLFPMKKFPMEFYQRVIFTAQTVASVTRDKESCQSHMVMR